MISQFVFGRDHKIIFTSDKQILKNKSALPLAFTLACHAVQILAEIININPNSLAAFFKHKATIRLAFISNIYTRFPVVYRYT
jgi:hypothetical protein